MEQQWIFNWNFNSSSSLCHPQPCGAQSGVSVRSQLLQDSLGSPSLWKNLSQQLSKHPVLLTFTTQTAPAQASLILGAPSSQTELFEERLQFSPHPLKAMGTSPMSCVLPGPHKPPDPAPPEPLKQQH